ncbi:MAG: CoA-acylating methylmalonate-semialdehyde dehydrogenase [Gammaproteobacteria bacterium]
MDSIPHYIHGQPIRNHQGTLPIYNPALGQIIREVEVADKAIIEQAVQSARSAYVSWSKQTPLNRARILFKFKIIVEQRKFKIASIITEEHGKTTEDALGEVQRALEVIEFACGIPHLLKGEYSAEVGRNIDSWSLYSPLGVVAGITPFNFPCMVPMWMIPIALATGNTFILKPSEKDPSSSILIADYLKEAGLPDGVFNVVQGDRNAVEALLMHPDIAAISFVGSTPVAQSIYEKGSQSGKRVQALGGAKNHLVVMPDANINSVCRALIGSAYGSAGERCMAISVAVAVGDIADSLVEKLTPMIQELRVGPGHLPTSEMGPVISEQHLKHIHQHIEYGIQEGAKLIVDGRNLAVPEYEKGFFIGGSLFDQVQPHMQIYQAEIFGPVLCIVRVSSLENALQLIKQHPFGNGSAIFTQNGHAAREFSHQVETGMVGVNVPIPVPMAYHCFGGWKRSLFGQSHMHGPEGVRFYTRMKTITERWEDTQEINLSMPILK